MYNPGSTHGGGAQSTPPSAYIPAHAQPVAQQQQMYGGVPVPVPYGVPSTTTMQQILNPNTAMGMGVVLPPSQQSIAPSSSISHVHHSHNEPVSTIATDPIAQARQLILRDLRLTLTEVNRSAADFSRQSGRNVSAPSTTPGNVAAPLSVNPQSVNPMSANPSSVKSSDEPKSVESPEKAIRTPHDGYLNTLNNFLAVCDQIEMNLMVVSECQKQCNRFDKMFAGELRLPGEIDKASYSQFGSSYLDSTARLKDSLLDTVNALNTTFDRVNALSTVNLNTTHSSSPLMDTSSLMQQ